MNAQTVLIADDIAANRKLLHVTLRSEGFKVFEAADGPEALGHPDAQHGRLPALLCEVRKTDRLQTLPFVFHTATYLSSSDEKLAMKMGADIFLRKPASAQTIVQTFKDARTSRHAAQPSGSIQELEVMKLYSQHLIHKLEQKT